MDVYEYMLICAHVWTEINQNGKRLSERTTATARARASDQKQAYFSQMQKS